MGYLEQALAALDSARRTGGRNIQDLFSDPSAYAEKIAGHLRNTNAGVTPVASAGELTNRPLTMEERVNDTLNSLDFGGGMGVIKPKGGNWLSGKYGPEAQLKTLKPGMPNPEVDPVLGPELYARHAALNSWIDNQLTKYVKNDMAAPTDPIRKLADAWPEEKAQKLAVAEARVQKLRAKQQAQAATRGVPEEYLTQTRQDILAAEEARDLIAENTGLHIPVREVPPGTESSLMGKRAEAGFPVHGMATTPLGRQWETQVDSEFNPRPVKDFLLAENLRQDPWLAKADPNAKVNTMMFNTLMYGAGDLSHIIDELANSLRAGRLTPEQLSKMPIDQAVRHVAEINALRKVNAGKRQAMDASEIPVFKDYPEQGMSWRQLHDKDTDKLQKWLTQEGDAMGHCVGGYCDDVAAGRSNIYSLRDAKGKPHVTIETMPNVDKMRADDWYANTDSIPQEFYARYPEPRITRREDPETYDAWTAQVAASPEYQAYAAKIHPLIAQIKGPSNAAPAAEHLPFIQDFIKQGKWSDIGDLSNAGMWRNPKTGQYHTIAEAEADPVLGAIYDNRNLDEHGNFIGYRN